MNDMEFENSLAESMKFFPGLKLKHEQKMCLKASLYASLYKQ
jgi:hypothetical protein